MTTMTIAGVMYAEERLADMLSEMRPLLVEHWQEIAAYPDIPLAVDDAFYAEMDRQHRLVIVTARKDGHLIGYAVFLLNFHAHYRTSLQATQDVLYLHPSHRTGRTGLRLIQATERILKAKGVQVVHQHVKVAHPALGRLLAHEGYTQVEALYCKRLDRESNDGV